MTYDYEEDEEQEETTCPCGCDDDPKFCVYASTCVTCKEKYFGNGYGEKRRACPSCHTAHPEKYLQCGHLVEGQSMEQETGKFKCDECGAEVK